ncbi:hypothetical protein KKE19_03200 [Patescibacteria group bacterium]|nr:hypothetical protein [Patescibacteria group bacterium]MBU4367785.1 hypothetical protein [Patescibacteria group bacterium]MBU4461475.1 hypothetical protein [Patescibacteria group bacterium]MCG2700393.1 hypothetical protein [Candidatus Parcubacteria bacterium]
MIYLLLFINILLSVSVYIFAYSFSLFAIELGPFFWICNAGGFVIAYIGIGKIKELLFIAIRNDKEEIKNFLSKMQFTGEKGEVIADPFKNFKKYIFLSLLSIVLFGFFGIFMYVMMSKSPDFPELKEKLNTLFFAFSIIGAILGLTPIKERIKKILVVKNHNNHITK